MSSLVLLVSEATKIQREHLSGHICALLALAYPFREDDWNPGVVAWLLSD